jgi:MFS family permease
LDPAIAATIDPMPSRPTRSETWLSYAWVATMSSLLYGLGVVTPLLRDEFGLLQSVAALHAAALAAGVIAAGFVADRIERRLGARRALWLAVLALGLSGVLVALSPHVAVSLAAGVLIGFGGGALLANVTPRLAGSSDDAGRVRMLRANSWPMVTALAIPVAVGATTVAGVGWRPLFLVPVAALAALTVIASRQARAPGGAVEGRRADGTVPAPFWRAWTFVLLGVAIEFSVLFWASTLVATRTGLPLPEAVSLGAFFLVGILGGRLAISSGVAGRVASSRLLVAGLGLAVAGAFLVWVATDVPLAAAALVLVGIGTGMFYPIGVTVAMAQAPDAPVVASTRLQLATGTAVLTAPLALGVIADAVGVVSGWLLVPLLAAAAVAVLATIPTPAAERTQAAASRGAAAAR